MSGKSLKNVFCKFNSLNVRCILFILLRYGRGHLLRVSRTVYYHQLQLSEVHFVSVVVVSVIFCFIVDKVL